MTLRYDFGRIERIGMPEAVLCSPKSDEQIVAIIAELHKSPETPVLFTRLDSSRHEHLADEHRRALDYDPLSRTAFLHGGLARRPGRVAVVAAGTSDSSVAAEACRTLEFSGVEATQIVDVGVAGLWRLQERLEEIRQFDIVIVVAGMDAALASVVGGLIEAPVIAVPTSVGYGVAEGGATALNSMLASCAQGIAVTNVDNGFGAACAAVRILNRFLPSPGDRDS